MKYIGAKFGHYYFQNENNDIYEISPLSEDVHFCCNYKKLKHKFEESKYTAKEAVYTIDKLDLLVIRIDYLKQNEKMEFKYIGSENDSKYFLDNFNNVYGFSKTNENEIYLCGLRRSKEFKLSDLKNSIGLDFKRQVTSITHSELKTIEKPKVFHDKAGNVQNKTRKYNRK